MTRAFASVNIWWNQINKKTQIALDIWTKKWEIFGILHNKLLILRQMFDAIIFVDANEEQFIKSDFSAANCVV